MISHKTEPFLFLALLKLLEHHQRADIEEREYNEILDFHVVYCAIKNFYISNLDEQFHWSILMV